jgi:hypothetical protein
MPLDKMTEGKMSADIKMVYKTSVAEMTVNTISRMTVGKMPADEMPFDKLSFRLNKSSTLEIQFQRPFY